MVSDYGLSALGVRLHSANKKVMTLGHYISLPTRQNKLYNDTGAKTMVKCPFWGSPSTAQLLCSSLPRPPATACSHRTRRDQAHIITPAPASCHTQPAPTRSTPTLPYATMRLHPRSAPLLVQSSAPPPYHPYRTSPSSALFATASLSQ